MKIITSSKIIHIEDLPASDSSSAVETAESRIAHENDQSCKKRSGKQKQETSPHDKQRADPTGDSKVPEDDEQTESTISKTTHRTVKSKTEQKAELARVDSVFDKDKFRFVQQPSSEKSKTDEFGHYALIVRRVFNYDNEYEETCLDILSKPLKAAMARVMGEVQSVSFDGAKSSIDPDIAFLFLEDLRIEVDRLKKQSRSEIGKRLQQTTREAKHLKVLVEYLDADYDTTTKTLRPLLRSRKITFNLVWALFKSDELIYAPTYGVKDEARVFKVDVVDKDLSPITKAERYRIEGRFLDWDGSAFGMVKITFFIHAFKGPRDISSLECFPLKYHPDFSSLKPALIERGKKFVALKGQKCRLLQGRAFVQHKGQTKKFILDGRVMIDAATFRRMNPDYPVSVFDGKGDKLNVDADVQTESISNPSSSEESQSEDEDGGSRPNKMINGYVVQPLSDEGNFTDQHYIMASPVLLGFSLSEKIWIEFVVSGVRDIAWDDGAFAALVLPTDRKNHLRALVEHHACDSDHRSDDIIKGKGRGLIALLYGSPGTGKTLTGESISELLKRPLYSVSMGDLGGKRGELEKNLTEILDLATRWNAVLLIDEAEVFLEQRQPQNTGHNVLVSTFLRMLEYYRGILLLTTNYLTAFDKAILSRITLGIRYDDFDVKARKCVWRLCVDKARTSFGNEIGYITEEDYETLSKHEMNGREVYDISCIVTNVFQTAAAIAHKDKQVLNMKHLLQALAFATKFADDMKGPGYKEARKMFV